MIKLTQLEYHLPKNLIANSPASPRDSSHLMVIDRTKQTIQHKIFNQLPDLLTENDVLVFNNSKVFPARLIGKKDTVGKIEILLLSEKGNGIWEAMHKGKLSPNQKIIFKNLIAEVKSVHNEIVEIKFTDKNYWQKILKIGQTPLPPYINSNDSENALRKKYQTVYANPVGSAAAPTAGLHFTKNLLKKNKDKGIKIEYVTLHVGLGTFAPVKSKTLEHHKIHSEYYQVDQQTINRLIDYKQKGKRIVAVGTTTVRVLETITKTQKNSAETDIFIYPPYRFNIVDALITNFHLPKSTLLALVSAFSSFPNTEQTFKDFQSSLIGKAYFEAIKNNYRFYSFGDAMFIS